MITRIRANIEAIRANGESTGWRTQHYPPSSRLSSRQSGRKILLVPCHQAPGRFPCPPRTPVLGYRATSLTRLPDAILALPELLFLGYRAASSSDRILPRRLLPSRSWQAPTKLPSILGPSVLLPFFLAHPLVRFLLLSLREACVLDS